MCCFCCLCLWGCGRRRNHHHTHKTHSTRTQEELTSSNFKSGPTTLPSAPFCPPPNDSMFPGSPVGVTMRWGWRNGIKIVKILQCAGKNARRVVVEDILDTRKNVRMFNKHPPQHGSPTQKNGTNRIKFISIRNQPKTNSRLAVGPGVSDTIESCSAESGKY